MKKLNGFLVVFIGILLALTVRTPSALGVMHSTLKMGSINTQDTVSFPKMNEGTTVVGLSSDAVQLNSGIGKQLGAICDSTKKNDCASPLQCYKNPSTNDAYCANIQNNKGDNCELTARASNATDFLDVCASKYACNTKTHKCENPPTSGNNCTNIDCAPGNYCIASIFGKSGQPNVCEQAGSQYTPCATENDCHFGNTCDTTDLWAKNDAVLWNKSGQINFNAAGVCSASGVTITCPSSAKNCKSSALDKSYFECTIDGQNIVYCPDDSIDYCGVGVTNCISPNNDLSCDPKRKLCKDQVGNSRLYCCPTNTNQGDNLPECAQNAPSGGQSCQVDDGTGIAAIGNCDKENKATIIGGSHYICKVKLPQ